METTCAYVYIYIYDDDDDDDDDDENILTLLKPPISLLGCL